MPQASLKQLDRASSARLLPQIRGDAGSDFAMPHVLGAARRQRIGNTSSLLSLVRHASLRAHTHVVELQQQLQQQLQMLGHNSSCLCCTWTDFQRFVVITGLWQFECFVVLM